MKKLLEKLFSWFPLYRSTIGGYWFYNLAQETRYHAGQFCAFGNNVKIGSNVVISKPERMMIGDGVLIEPHCYIRATGGFQIGNYSGLGQYTSVLTTDHNLDSEAIPFDDVSVIKPVIIEDHVWVGSNVAILGGVTIGEGSIIGLGSVIRKDIPPCAIAVGNPARVIGYRDKERYAELKQRNAVMAPRPSLGRFVISSAMNKKYRDLLDDIGFDPEIVEGIDGNK